MIGKEQDFLSLPSNVVSIFQTHNLLYGLPSNTCVTHSKEILSADFANSYLKKHKATYLTKSFTFILKKYLQVSFNEQHDTK
jgi:hypothetical protein